MIPSNKPEASIQVLCCSSEAKWVENVPGKGYFFCQSCKNEVLYPTETEVNKDVQKEYIKITILYR